MPSEHLYRDAVDSLRHILLQALKQYSDYKSLIVKNFDGNALKMEVASAI